MTTDLPEPLLPDTPLPDPLAPDPLAPARAALERGDYGRVLQLLEALTAEHPPASRTGAELQLLMATALMGRGDTVRAMACCRQVKRCADPGLRGQARDLLEVLQAPALERPREWSLTLPELGEAEPIAGRLRQMARQRRRSGPPPPPPPPVGPTRAPIGFAAVVLALLLMGLLLGGCVQVRAELEFGSPGRLALQERLSPMGGQPPLPWQRQSEAALRQLGLRSRGEALVAPMQPAEATLQLLASSITTSAQLAGLTLPPPSWDWRERNWLVGVQQQLSLRVDLREAAAIPGLEASLDLRPLVRRAVQRAEPEPVQPLPAEADGPRLRWPLRPGAINRLDLRCWRWSPLGLGAVVVAAALALVLGLSALRQRLGFGWPQLPS